MRIKEILSQHRRDFTAIYECEHCGHTKRSAGYDDDHFYRNVVPQMQCEACKQERKVRKCEYLLETRTFEPYDLVYAFENAAEFLENEEWPEDDQGAQHGANAEAARRIRRMATRYAKTNMP